MSGLFSNALFLALIWMLFANLAAMGPDRFKTPALAVMLVCAGALVPMVIRDHGWIVGLPIVALMLFQMRWTVYFIARLMRHYGLLPPR